MRVSLGSSSREGFGEDCMPCWGVSVLANFNYRGCWARECRILTIAISGGVGSMVQGSGLDIEKCPLQPHR